MSLWRNPRAFFLSENNLNKRILLLDADVIAFRNCAVIEKRSIEATSVKTGVTKAFKNRTELKSFVTDKGFEYNKDNFIIKDIVVPGKFHTLTVTMPQTINRLQAAAEADQVELHVGAEGGTFRNKLPLPSKYKDRDKSTVPEHLEAAKEFLIENYSSVSIPGIEADDSITIRAYEELNRGNIPIIGTIDKDAMQSQGCYVMNITDKEPKPILIQSVGDLYKHKTTYKGSGLKFLIWQTLAGDKVDTYQPYELSELTYGEANAFKAINPCSTEKELLEKCITEYKRLYPEPVSFVDQCGNRQTFGWEQFLLTYWRCAYMMRTFWDEGNFWDYASKYFVFRKDFV